MSETLEERKARIMRHLEERGVGEFNDFAVAPPIGYSQEWWEAWAALLAEDKIEYMPRSPENIYMAKFRVKMQMRLI